MSESESAWQWPFSKADLTAGLRRYSNDLTVQVTEVNPSKVAARRPSVGAVHGLQVAYTGENGAMSANIVVKEPRGSTRTGLAGAGRREVGVYNFLAGQVPMVLPTLIAASPSGDWLIMEAIPPSKEASEWRRDDYLQAVDALAQLHDRFWSLGEDLNAFPWLSRPLTADFKVHVTAAAQSIERIAYRREPESIASSPQRMKLFKILTSEASTISRPLLRSPSTLLHGDYWPGNISVLSSGQQIVFDWQMTAIGPAILDLVIFIKKSEWWFNTLPISQKEIVGHYRDSLHAKLGIRWENDEWDELWDHAIMWSFLQEWMDLLAASPDSLLVASGDQLDRIWLEPVQNAIDRRLSSV